MTIKARKPIRIMYTKVVYKDDSNTMSYKVIHHTPGDCTWSTNTSTTTTKRVRTEQWGYTQQENMSVGLCTLMFMLWTRARSVRNCLSRTGSSPKLSTISIVRTWSSLVAASCIVRNNWLFNSWKNL